MKIFITGHSAGIGHALATKLLTSGHTVFGVSRRSMEVEDSRLREIAADLSELNNIRSVLNDLLDSTTPDLVFLNAGVLGDFKKTSELSTIEINNTLNINAWSNKTILDWLLEQKKHPQQIILLSSGASLKGNIGWGSYAISKSVLNMLALLYSEEFKKTHISAIAPGIVETDMQQTLRRMDTKMFPSINRLKLMYKTKMVQSAVEAAGNIISHLEAIKSQKTGSFIDLRTFLKKDR